MDTQKQETDKFPIFRNPEEYMAMRHKPGLDGRVKIWSERRALDRCFSVMSNVKSVLDVPSGPGRLFWYWKERGLRVLGFDFSEEMVEASLKHHAELGLDGRVAHANAFELPAFSDDERPDLVASVRFAYYFNPAKRIELLRSLAGASNRYLLVMYKTTETLKGYINEASDREEGKPPRQPHMAKAGCTHHQIMREFAAAGLAVIRIQNIGEFSDRVYVVAEKIDADAPPLAHDKAPRINIRSGGKTGIGALMIAMLFLLMMFGLAVGEFWRVPEAMHALAVRDALAGNWTAPRPAPLPHDGTLSLPLVWIASVLSLVAGGFSETVLRFANVLLLAGALSIPLVLGRRIRNYYLGILGALMLATSYDFWKLAAEVRPEIVDMLLVGGAWLTAWSGVRRDRASMLVFSWSLAGIAAISTGWEPILLTGLAWLGLPHLLRARGDTPKGGGIGSFAAGLLVAACPVAIWVGASTMVAGWQTTLDWMAPRWGDSFGFTSPLVVAWTIMEGTMPWSLLLPLALWSRFRRGGRTRSTGIEDYCLFLLAVVVVTFTFLPTSSDESFALVLPWMMIPCAGVAWRWLLWVGRGISEGAAAEDRRFWGTMLGRLPGKVFIISALLLVIGYATAILVVPLAQSDRDSPRAAVANVQRYVGASSPLILFDITDARLLYYLGDDMIFLSSGGDGTDRLGELLAEHPRAVLLLETGDRDEVRPVLSDPERLGRIRFRGDRLILVDPGSA